MTKKVSHNLIKVFGRKEAKFWKRTWTMRKKLSWVGFGIALIFITIGHYLFAGMHFLFECLLFIVMRPQFRANLNKMYSQTI
jgi:hypothetical protein